MEHMMRSTLTSPLAALALLVAVSAPSLAADQVAVNQADIAREINSLQRKVQQQNDPANYREGGQADQDALRRASEFAQQGAFDQAGSYLELVRRRVGS
jgi:hypothetical protein